MYKFRNTNSRYKYEFAKFLKKLKIELIHTNNVTTTTTTKSLFLGYRKFTKNHKHA